MIYRAQGSHGNDLAFQVSHGSNLRARDQIKTGLGHHREHTSQRRALDGPADAAAEGGGVINAAAQDAGQRDGGSDLNELRRDSALAEVAFGIGEQRRKVVQIAGDIADDDFLVLRGRRARTLIPWQDGERNRGEKQTAPAEEPQFDDAH